MFFWNLKTFNVVAHGKSKFGRNQKEENYKKQFYGTNPGPF